MLRKEYEGLMERVQASKAAKGGGDASLLDLDFSEVLSSPSKSRPCCSNKKRSNNKIFQDTEATGPTSQAVSLNTSALQVEYTANT